MFYGWGGKDISRKMRKQQKKSHITHFSFLTYKCVATQQISRNWFITCCTEITLKFSIFRPWWYQVIFFHKNMSMHVILIISPSPLISYYKKRTMSFTWGWQSVMFVYLLKHDADPFWCKDVSNFSNHFLPSLGTCHIIKLFKEDEGKYAK